MLPVPLAGREVIENLTTIAAFMAGSIADRPGVLASTHEALQDDRKVLNWLQHEFEARSPSETLWQAEPFIFDGDPTRDTILLGISKGNRDGSEVVTRYYRLEGGRLHDANAEADPEKMYERRALVWSWECIDTLQPEAEIWGFTALTALRNDLSARAAAPLNAPTQLELQHKRAVRLAVQSIANNPNATWEEVLTGYLALGVNPAQTIAEAISGNMPTTCW